MANIAITESCNLNCKYCFANEYVNKHRNDITFNNFIIAKDFILSSKEFNGRIGIIGGEPTVHPEFDRILSNLEQDERVKSVTIFTNGIRLNEFFPLVIKSKFKFLINLNSPLDIGNEFYKQILSNIDKLIENGKQRDLTLGLNIYKPDLDYSFYIEALESRMLQTARLSITVPNGKQAVGLERHIEFKKILYKLIVELMFRGIKFLIDCNKPPKCTFSEEEIDKLSLIGACDLKKPHGIDLGTCSCNPVIDILPDLTAIRCFGLSRISKVKISDFATIGDLREYYIKVFDDKLISSPMKVGCIDCPLYKEQKCNGGCFANKRND